MELNRQQYSLLTDFVKVFYGLGNLIIHGALDIHFCVWLLTAERVLLR